MLFRMRLLSYVLKTDCVIFKYKKMFRTKPDFSIHDISWRPGVAVITTGQLYSTKPELRFCAGSNPAGGLSEISDDGDLWQWARLEIWLNVFCRSAIPPKQLSSSLSPYFSSKPFLLF